MHMVDVVILFSFLNILPYFFFFLQLFWSHDSLLFCCLFLTSLTFKWPSSSEPSENYYKDLAEARREALAETLEENQNLHDFNEQLQSQWIHGFYAVWLTKWCPLDRKETQFSKFFHFISPRFSTLVFPIIALLYSFCSIPRRKGSVVGRFSECLYDERESKSRIGQILQTERDAGRRKSVIERSSRFGGRRGSGAWMTAFDLATMYLFFRVFSCQTSSCLRSKFFSCKR